MRDEVQSDIQRFDLTKEKFMTDAKDILADTRQYVENNLFDLCHDCLDLNEKGFLLGTAKLHVLAAMLQPIMQGHGSLSLARNLVSDAAINRIAEGV